MLVGKLVQFVRVLAPILGYDVHGLLGQDDARPTIGKHHLANLHLTAQVVRLRGIQDRQPPHQIGPDDVRVGLHKHIPLGLGTDLQSLVDHGQELPLVQLPARIVLLPKRVLGIVAVPTNLVLLEARPAEFVHATVQFKVRVGVSDGFIDPAQDIDRPDPLDGAIVKGLKVLLVVGKYGVVRHAAERGGQMHGDLAAGFRHARLEDDHDLFHFRGRLEAVLCVGEDALVP